MKLKLNLLFFTLFILLPTAQKINGQPTTLRINEFMALNESVLADEDGEYSDWIEIYNPASTSVNLKGWALTDDKRYPKKWLFPAVTIEKNSYLVLFASGKNRINPGMDLHTSFKLSGTGEYLALTNPDGTAVTKFDPYYPAQEPDISYGYFSNTILSYLNPSPGSLNQYIWSAEIPAPVLNQNRGFYDAPFTLQITSQDPNAEIYYTTNGSVPGKDNGEKYSVPIDVQSTMVVRAVALKSELKPSKVTTRTYLFLNDIIHQPANVAGFPLQWGRYTGISGISIADYEMDPEMMADPETVTSVKKALKSLPTISLVTEKGYLFSSSQDIDTGGIYIYTGPPLTDTTNGTGFGWERPVSFEYFDANDSVSFQVNCGVELHGGHSRRAEKSPKHSFRLVFKNIYGPSKLNFPLFGEGAVSEFNAIVLRAGFNNTWIHHSNSERVSAQYINDTWAKDTQRAMRYNSSNGIFVHLYINGLYWGIYNPSEKLDKEYAASYLGGNSGDYDVIKDYAEVVDGNKSAWNKLILMANAGLSGNAAYQQIIGNNADGSPNPAIESMVDVVNLADYMILNFYAGNSDWDHHNWVAMRNRVNPGKGFSFFCWDEEKILEDINVNILNENNNNRPSGVFQKLMQNADFQRLFSDRVQKFCFQDGILTPASTNERWNNRAAQTEDAIIAESARWGDYRRDVHRWQTEGPFDLYTPDGYWLPRMDFMLNTYFPNRTDIFLDQLRNNGLFPSVNAPIYKINNNPVTGRFINSNDVLTISSEEGVIYYTTDGSDPVIWNPVNKVSSSATIYSGTVTLKQSSHIKARTFSKGIWSALNDRFFLVSDDFRDIKITEINYHPLDQGIIDNKDLEFLELKNTGASTLDIGGLEFIEGIKFRFPPEIPLRPNEFIVLASNSNSFTDYYNFIPFGEYSGQLEDNGEQIVLISAEKDTIISFSYSNNTGWPASPDGIGNTLVSSELNPDNPQDKPEYWRASYYYGGSPGADDVFNPENIKDTTQYDLITVYPQYPNPFSDHLYIPYTLHVEAKVELSVFNMNGQKIVTIENGWKESGDYVVAWKGTDQDNNVLVNGMYFFRIVVKSQSETNILTRKVILIR